MVACVQHRIVAAGAQEIRGEDLTAEIYRSSVTIRNHASTKMRRENSTRGGGGKRGFEGGKVAGRGVMGGDALTMAQFGADILVCASFSTSSLSSATQCLSVRT